MPEPSLAPNDTLDGVEPTRSSSPTRGAGLLHEQRSPSTESLHYGRVEDGYGTAGGYLVALYNYQRNLPCRVLGHAGGRFFGARPHRPIPVGTEVLVHVPRDGKSGVILGVLPTVDDPPHERPAPQLVPEGGVNVFSDQEAFNAFDYGVAGGMPHAGGGQPVDALPGDDGVTNDLNAGFGVNRLFAWLRGGELSSVECHPLDDLVRLIVHRLQIFTAAGEDRVNDDYGRISRERSTALTQAESLGASADTTDTCQDNDGFSLTSTPDESSLKAADGQGATGRWRQQELEGWLGDFFQRHLVRPSTAPRKLDGSDPGSDVVLFQDFLSRCGQHLQRSLVGGGQVRSLGIAAPRRLRADDDPEGNRETPDDAPARKPFSIVPKGVGPAGFSAQVGDWVAWEFDQRAKAPAGTLPKDFVTPDDADALSPHESFTVPGVGGYFREAPPVTDAAKAVGQVPDETKDASTPYRPGQAFALLLPDGSVHSRDAWGAETRTGYGHVNLSCSHDVNITAGGSVIIQAGDDIVLRAGQAIDLSSTENQVRIKGQKDVLIHTEEGGMLLSAPAEGGVDLQPGEKLSLSGIALKTGGTVTVVADEADFALDEMFYVGPGENGQNPEVRVRGSDLSFWSDSTVALANGADGQHGVLVSDGGVYASGDLQVDGQATMRGDVVAGGGVQAVGDILAGGDVDAFGSINGNEEGGSPPDVGDVPRVSTYLSDYFQDGTWQDYQQPYAPGQLGKLQFSFRSTEECAAADLEVYEAAWQRELAGDLQAWRENAVNNSYPWPGADHYNGTQKLFAYREANVQADGTPKARAEQSAAGGSFAPKGFDEFLVLGR